MSILDTLRRHSTARPAIQWDSEKTRNLEALVVTIRGQEDGLSMGAAMTLAAQTLNALDEAATQGGAQVRPVRARADLFPGGHELIGKYRCRGLLGRGGNGAVYLAENTSLGNYPVVIKFLLGSLETGVDPELLRKEGIAMTTLSGDHTVKVKDFSEAEQEKGIPPHLIMEYVEGETLGWYLDEHQLSNREILHIWEGICKGIYPLHKHNRVHRDLKPGNVLITKNGKPVVIDFGLAYQLAQIEEERRNTIVGTLGYLSPEQVPIDPRHVRPLDHRSDIFALGLILYEMFTGTQAQEAKTEREALKLAAEGSLPAIVEREYSVERRAGLERKERQEERFFAREIERRIAECCRFEPDERPAHIGVILDDLKRKEARFRTHQKRMQDVRRWAPATGAATLAVGGGLAAVYVTEYHNPAMLEKAATMIGRAEDARQLGSRSEAREYLEEGERSVRRVWFDDSPRKRAVHWAILRDLLDDVVELGDYARAKSLEEDLDATMPETLPITERLFVEARRAQAHQLTEEALKRFIRLEELSPRVAAPTGEDGATELLPELDPSRSHMLADLYLRAAANATGNEQNEYYRRAIDVSTNAVKLLETKMAASDSPEQRDQQHLVMSLLRRAWARHDAAGLGEEGLVEERVEEAMRDLERAQRNARYLGQHHLNSLIQKTLSDWAFGRGDLESAIRFAERSIAIIEGNEDRTSRGLGALALGYEALAQSKFYTDIDASLAAYTKAEEILEELQNRRDQAETIYNRSNALLQLGRLAEARTSGVEGLGLARQFGNTRAEAMELLLLGDIAYAQGSDLDEAVSMYDRGLSTLDTLQGSVHGVLARIMKANALIALGQTGSAAAILGDDIEGEPGCDGYNRGALEAARGSLALAQGAPRAALKRRLLALAAAENETEYPNILAEIAWTEGSISATLGDVEGTRAAAYGSIRLADESGMVFVAAMSRLRAAESLGALAGPDRDGNATALGEACTLSIQAQMAAKEYGFLGIDERAAALRSRLCP